MTPTYIMNSLSSPNNSTHHIEQNDHEVHPNLMFISSPSQASSSSSLSCPIFFNLTQDQTLNYDGEQPHEIEARKDLLHGGSSDQEFLSSPSSIPTMENDINYGLKFSMIWKHDEDKDHDNIIPSDMRTGPSISGSVKWMSSKMRLMKKMMNSSRAVDDGSLMSPHKFQTQQIKQPSNLNLEKNNCSSSSHSSPINGNNSIRVCADCNTTKTPLWRSGPRGPKSLCNACGIRQRKARRAMAAAAASSGALEAPSTQSRIKHKKEKGSGKGYTSQYKNKRCKFTSGTTPPSRKKLCFEDFTISLMSKSSALHRVFPQDEKEAAILLMALSCGLVHG